jgi:phage-related protein
MAYTKKLYTNSRKTVNFPSLSKVEEKLVPIDWEPGTNEALRAFPDGPRGNLGYHLYLVQKGEIPPDSSPVPGVPGAFELRDEDGSGWYRVVHLKKINDKIHVLHCFAKQSNQIEKRDIRTIQERLGRLNHRLAEERKNAKREKSHNDG